MSSRLDDIFISAALRGLAARLEHLKLEVRIGVVSHKLASQWSIFAQEFQPLTQDLGCVASQLLLDAQAPRR